MSDLDLVGPGVEGTSPFILKREGIRFLENPKAGPAPHLSEANFPPTLQVLCSLLSLL